MNLSKLSIEQLVTEIIAVNHAYKEAEELFGSSNTPLVRSLKRLKDRLQVQLLRNYAPDHVYLIEDRQSESDELLYGLRLIKPVRTWKDAAHLPVRVAKQILSPQELEKFVRSE